MRRVVALIHATRNDGGILTQCLLQKRNNHVGVCSRLEDVMLQNKLMLIFQHAHRKTQFCVHTRFAFIDPARMGSWMEKTFSECEIFSSLINRRAIYLTHRMRQIPPPRVCAQPLCLQVCEGPLGPLNQLVTQLQIGPDRCHIPAPASRADPLEGRLDFLLPVLILASARHPVGGTTAAQGVQKTPHRVPE